MRSFRLVVERASICLNSKLLPDQTLAFPDDSSYRGSGLIVLGSEGDGPDDLLYRCAMRMFVNTPAVAMLLGLSAYGQTGRIAPLPTVGTLSASRFAKPSALKEKWGDQGNGTYVNPVLPGDYSDTDVIRVADSFYMISSTMQYAPGMVVLESKDLVNWRTIGHVMEDLPAIDRALNWDQMDRPGRGLWAGSIRFHSGRFWVYFGTPDQGIYVSTADTAAGPWSAPRLVLGGAGWDDPCSFRDDDGQNYLVTTHFAPEGSSQTTYNIHLFKLSEDGFSVVPGLDRILHRSNGSEANKLYKIDGLYYHYYSEVKAEGRVPMMERSESLDGPWQSRQLMHVHGFLDKEPNQGGLVQLPSGKWYFVSHQGKGDWEGRATVLLPVTWVEGWPIIGKIGADGVGSMVWEGQKPISGYSVLDAGFSDDFSSSDLAPAWEWRYQPNPEMWSLHERSGYLRLHALPRLPVGGFRSIPNVLTQRSMRTRRNQFTVQLDLTGMETGQVSGIAHFAKTYASLTVEQIGNVRRLIFDKDGVRTRGPLVKGRSLWLRSDWDFAGKSSFSFSFDGTIYRRLGTSYRLTWGDYRGDRIGIFTSNGSGAGYLDVKRVRYKTAH